MYVYLYKPRRKQVCMFVLTFAYTFTKGARERYLSFRRDKLPGCVGVSVTGSGIVRVSGACV